MNRNYYILAGGFIVLCLILCGGIWYSIAKLRECREEYDQLDAERHNNSGIISSLEARNERLSSITSLNINNSVIVADAVAFFSIIRPMMETHKLNLLYLTTSGQDSSGNKDNTLQLKIDGGYYDLADMLADLRALNVPSKITRLSLKRNNKLPEEHVEADLTIEVMTEE